MKKQHFLPFILGALAFVLLGCAETRSPDLPIPAKSSLGPNGAHSGVYAVTVSPSGAIVSQTWYESKRDAYNALAKKHAAFFTPPLTADSGLTQSGVYWIADPDAVEDFILMEALEKGASP